MSGAEVISLISGVIAIIEAAQKIYDAAADAKGQPHEFRQVAARLPLVIGLLNNAKAGVPRLNATEQEGLETILQSCEDKAESLEKMFRRVIRKDDDKWHERYKKAVVVVTKGKQVESLMGEILKDVQVIVCDKLKDITTSDQVKELGEAIKEMKETPSSLQEERGSVTQNHDGSGNNNANTGPGPMHTGTGDLYQNEIKGDAYIGSNISKQVNNHYNSPHDSENRSCLKDLRTTDPREDKRRIEETKGGLLKDSYRWILENSDYQQWRDDTLRPLLWIKGDPGKGKTMLLCGIIDELSRGKDIAALPSYFFCQATDSRLNNATAVLGGLIYLLIEQQPSLISHVQKRYDQGAKTPFEGVNGWAALSIVFEDILRDSKSQSGTYLIVDALDECDINLPQLLNLITQSASRFPSVKWVVSSRNKSDIEARLRLDRTQVRLSLELNREHVSRAVEIFIAFRVSQLPLLADDSTLQEMVRRGIYAKAAGTFLWVALVLKELVLVESWDVLEVLDEIPSGLKSLYHRMIQQIDQLQRKDPEFCRCVLSTMILAYRPLLLDELAALSGLPERISKSHDYVARVVRQCGSFLTIRGGTVFFIHQSAKDYLSEETQDKFFPDGSRAYHHMIFKRSLQVMSLVLERDVYNLKAPGITIDQVKKPDLDPLAIAGYSCLYWVDHLLECQKNDTVKDLKDSGSVNKYLHKYFLYWLEALSLLKSVSEGVIIVQKLEDLQLNESPDLHAFIHDIRRFVVSNRSIIEQAPLQVYCSALVFAPEKSIVRNTFKECIPSWIQTKPRVEADWSAMLQALEGHTGDVNSVAFSSDGKQIVSGSEDTTVRRWDAATGQQLLPALEGHTRNVSSVAFSPDGKQIVSGSGDTTIRRWDAATGQQLLPALEGHTSYVSSVAFSPNGKQIVSGSGDTTVRRWDAATGQQLLPALEGHTRNVSSVAFSPDGKQIVSGSWDTTIRRWDAATGQQLLTALEGHTSYVSSVAFSPDGKQIVSGSYDTTIRRWDAATGQQLLPALEGHTSDVNSVASLHVAENWL
ncbi:hypothetical protein IFR05_016752, partial [Cadophora sp. M221]